jgi:hypothetical protein
MSITLFRVVNEQVDSIPRSILIDKADDGLPNTENYAQFRKQQVYVPYVNPVDTAVKGYSDFVPTDKVLLSADRGTIAGLVDDGYVTMTAFDSDLVVAPVVTNATNGAGDTTITGVATPGSTFLSVAPDRTRVYVTDTNGLVQIVEEASFGAHTATSIVFPDTAITGTPTTDWTIQVFANSKFSNIFTIL